MHEVHVPTYEASSPRKRNSTALPSRLAPIWTAGERSATLTLRSVRSLRMLFVFPLLPPVPSLYCHGLRRVGAAEAGCIADFAAGAGHEMNNPLAVISGRAQLLLRDEHDVERRHALALIRTQALRVHEMIADLMLFARPPAIKPEPVDLSALARSRLAEVAEEYVERNVVVESESVAPLGGEALRRSAASVTLVRGFADGVRLDADPIQLAVASRPSSAMPSRPCRTAAA